MRLATIALIAGLLAAPALAQTPAPPSDTLKAVMEKGITMSVMGNTGNIDYKPDGTFSGFDGQFEGTYKVDGSKLCITVAAFGLDNQCTTYPDGKKSGDSFILTDPNIGEMNVSIR
jgi:hypothetical protein